MESQTLILGIVIVALSLLVVALPFLSSGREKTVSSASSRLNGELERLQMEREAAYSTIRDLDFDYETGKLTEEDYLQQRKQWVARGVDILKAIDTLQQATGDVVVERTGVNEVNDDDDLDAQIEAAIAARRRTV